MTIKLERAKSKNQAAIISIQGYLDASNYKDLINVARLAKEEGAQYLHIDLSKLTSLSSSGMFALYSTALLMKGKEPPNPEYGWEAYRALDRDRSNGRQENVKLFNPQYAVGRTLEFAGMNDFFEIYTNLDTTYTYLTLNGNHHYAISLP